MNTLLAAGDNPAKNEFWYFLAYGLVWVVLLAYMVRLHFLIRDLRRRQHEGAGEEEAS